MLSFAIFSNLQAMSITDGSPSPSSLPVKTMNHCTGSILIPYLEVYERHTIISIY